MPQRQRIVADILEAQHAGARLAHACQELGLSVRTLERWREQGGIKEDGRPNAERQAPAHRLSEEERQQILEVCAEPRFADTAPQKIVATLADEGVFIASERSIYRVLHEAKQQHHRGRSRAPTSSVPTRHLAKGVNEVWTWDITWLPTHVKGMFFYLYAVIDLYSRKLVMWEIHEREAGEHAAELIEKACWREKTRGKPLVLHADNGSPQTAQTLVEKLRSLGIAPSHSRPSVSDDNAHIESWFRTAKYHGSYPSGGFADIEAARRWAMQFVTWYNHEHLHSGLGYVTPVQRHNGEDFAILEKRRQVYEEARQRHPARFRNGTRQWERPAEVWLNPPSKSDKKSVDG